MKTIFIFASLLLGSNVYADSIGILDCGTDKTISIEISKLPDVRTMDAQIVENGNYSNYQVKRNKNQFTGENFKLTLTNTKGEAKGHLEAITENGSQISEDLDCTIY